MARLSTSLIALLLLPAGVAFGQVPTQGVGHGSQPGNDYAMKLNDFTGNVAMVRRSKSEAVGSPYAVNRWLPAQLVTTANVALPTIAVKYDVLNHRLLMRPAERPNDSLQLDDHLLISFEPAGAGQPGRPGKPAAVPALSGGVGAAHSERVRGGAARWQVPFAQALYQRPAPGVIRQRV
ncbi:hypothetical protein ACFQT0_18530 [Hymenobacter humi]|uniref:Gingipain propeptide domain-containing protein n=1 Tax=Hymenobacter humi TaxID=1411620 RepID=A0ABW2U9Z6_9BACT